MVGGAAYYESFKKLLEFLTIYVGIVNLKYTNNIT